MSYLFEISTNDGKSLRLPCATINLDNVESRASYKIYEVKANVLYFIIQALKNILTFCITLFNHLYDAIRWDLAHCANDLYILLIQISFMNALSVNGLFWF